MSTKFFTNAGENTLLTKLEGIFQHMNIYYFDAVIGYFRASGYFRIYPYLKEVEKIRFLVGINVDNLTFKAYSKGLEFRANAQVTQEEYLKALIEDIQHSAYNKEVENGMLAFINDFISGKIQMKAHPSKTLHAKVYIFRQEKYHPHASYGAVITGSSNLTEAGLEKNFEFNVELRDHDDIVFATETFEKLWEEAVEITPNSIERVKKETYLNPDFTPFELYIKFLTEYFGKSIDYDPDDERDLPDGYMPLRYQQDAVNDGFRKLRKYNGFFLADVVGLGKTIVACMIAKKFYHHNGTRTRTLIIYPPALRSAWERTVRDFDLLNVKFISNGSLHKIKHPEDFDLIIVDEAHKFRSDTSDMFDKLQKLCKTERRNPGPDGDRKKKVILVSATPLNNKPEDIRNLILLFQDGRNSTLDTTTNIINFFAPLIERFKKAKHKTVEHGKDEVKLIYEKIRNKVLEQIIIRRTRTDILGHEEYAKDVAKQGIRFPIIEKPQPLYYILDAKLNELHERTIGVLQDAVHGLRYYRYQAIRYLRPPFKSKYQKAEDISRTLAFIMKTLLIKRLDSSFHSFVISLEKYCNANRAMITMFQNDRIHIAPSMNVSEFIMADNEDALIAKMEELRETDPSVETYSADAFEQGFEKGLIHDQYLLDDLVKEWKKWQANNEDPKLKQLLIQLKEELLNPEVNETGKLVVFSEYKDTTDYLKTCLKKAGYNNLLAVDSSNIKLQADKIAANFDARLDADKQENDIDIVITTEVLAEGVNLHRSHVILNYDIPWNSTRLMQRIGRVNRIGTTAKKVLIYNFYPTEQTESQIYLKKKAVLKLQAFHSALGEDSQIYSTEEEFGTFGLFEKELQEERDERLEYLLFLRQFRKQNLEWFKQIQNMPLRARTGRENKTQKLSTISYLKNARRDGFYYVAANDVVEEITFLDCAKLFKAFTSETGKPLPEHHHRQVLLAVEEFEKAQAQDRAEHRVSFKVGPNEQKAVGVLSTYARLEELAPAERDWLNIGVETIREGRFQKLPREINNLYKTAMKAKLKPVFIAEKVIEILKKYPLEKSTNGNGAVAVEPTVYDQPEIIISESFI